MLHHQPWFAGLLQLPRTPPETSRGGGRGVRHLTMSVRWRGYPLARRPEVDLATYTLRLPPTTILPLLGGNLKHEEHVPRRHIATGE